LGSHLSVTESFLAKIIENTKGVAERDSFVAALGNQGFGFVEGYDVKIEKDESGVERFALLTKKKRTGWSLLSLMNLCL